MATATTEHVFIMKRKRATGIALAVVGAVALLAACTLGQIANIFGLCTDMITVSELSPDERYIATTYQRTCATKGAITYVSIRPSRAAFRGRGEGVVFAVDWSVPIGFTWTDNSNLRIESIRCPIDEIFVQEKKWRDVMISHVSYGDTGRR